MLAPCVVGNFPLRVNNRPFAGFHDAVARIQPRQGSRPHHFHMSPLVAVVVDIVRNLAKENSFRPQNSMSLLGKGFVKMRKIVAVFRRGFDTQAKPLAEILLAILPLVRHMGGSYTTTSNTPVLKGIRILSPTKAG